MYLVTGASGHLGSMLVSELLRRNEKVRVFDLPGLGKYIPAEAELFEGDITDTETLDAFFDCKNYDYITLIHCAALITINTEINPKIWQINVTGTDNVMKKARSTGVNRVIYISTVHAIPAQFTNEIIKEVKEFSPSLVSGEYSKSKAEASQIVLQYAKEGLNVSIIHPSAIIGPGDMKGKNHVIRTINKMAKGTIPVAIHGGYDFVDVRDVVNGILACEKKGRPGECYFLNGHYLTIQELLNTVRRFCGEKPSKLIVPYSIVKIIAPAAEKLYVFLMNPLLY